MDLEDCRFIKQMYSDLIVVPDCRGKLAPGLSNLAAALIDFWHHRTSVKESDAAYIDCAIQLINSLHFVRLITKSR